MCVTSSSVTRRAMRRRLPTQRRLPQSNPQCRKTRVKTGSDELNRVSPPAASVTVTVPARLHLGFLDLNGGLGRRFGSIGLAISGLRTRLTIARAARTRDRRPGARARRNAISTRCSACSASTRAHRVTIDEADSGPRGPRLRHAARARGRGRRARVCTACRSTWRAMRCGSNAAHAPASASACSSTAGSWSTAGMVATHARRTDRQPACRFPNTGACCVVLDPARQGVHGPDEGDAFATLPPFPDHGRGAPLPARADEGAAGARRTRSCELRRRDQGNAAHARRLFRAGAGRTTASPARASRPASTCSTTPARTALGRARGARPALPSRARRRKPTAWRALARQHPSAKGLDIRVCTGLNRGADITARAAADAPRNTMQPRR